MCFKFASFVEHKPSPTPTFAPKALTEVAYCKMVFLFPTNERFPCLKKSLESKQLSKAAEQWMSAGFHCWFCFCLFVQFLFIRTCAFNHPFLENNQNPVHFVCSVLVWGSYKMVCILPTVTQSKNSTCENRVDIKTAHKDVSQWQKQLQGLLHTNQMFEFPTSFLGHRTENRS